MQVVMTTTNNEAEMYKAMIARKTLKSLCGEKPFQIEEMLVMEPEEGEDDARASVALKVKGTYYTGVSQEIMRTVTATIGMLNRMNMNNPEAGAEFLAGMKYQVIKGDGGRYGKMILEAV